MLEFLKNIFASDFLPHGTCYLWQPGVLWLNVISDLAISLAYYAIPVLLFWFFRKRRDVKFSWILVAFAAFILACGTTHLLSVWTVWHATYRLDGVVKAFTALASIVTAALLVPLLPTLVQLPNPMQLEAMNRELERRTQLLDLAQDALLVCGWDGMIRFWSRGAEVLYGWSKEQAMGRLCQELLKTQFPVPLASIVEQVEQKGHWAGELLHTRRDGSTVVVFSRWTARQGEDGRLEVLDLNTDISERKSFERSLEKKNEELAAMNRELERRAQLLDLAQDALLVRDVDGTIRFWNRGAEALYGWTAEEAVGQVSKDLLKTQFPAALESILEQMDRTGRWTGELHHTRRDGSPVVVFSRWSARQAEDGRLEFLELNSDISERKSIESSVEQKNAELEQASRRFQALLEAAPDGIIIGNASGEIVLVNSQTELLFGYPRKELLGRPIEVLLPEQFRATHPKHRAGYVHEPRPRPMGAGLELFGLRRDGTEFPVEISLSPIETEEGLLVISSVRDATERKQFEHRMREKNVELEKAISAKDVFLSSLSHELRTPLNAIIGYTGTLLMRLPGPLTTEQERQLKSIQTGGRHLLSLINDLLDLAKIESGKVHIHLETVECRDIVAEVASALRPLAEARELMFQSACPDSPLMVRTDRRALSQILLNLAGNAIKFTARGSVRLELTERAENGHLMAAIDVTDTGVGIKPEDLPRLFKPFDRLHDALRVEGTGLGLHLCHRLAELLEGRIQVESEYGRGSRFTVMIPKA